MKAAPRAGVNGAFVEPLAERRRLGKRPCIGPRQDGRDRATAGVETDEAVPERRRGHHVDVTADAGDRSVDRALDDLLEARRRQFHAAIGCRQPGIADLRGRPDWPQPIAVHRRTDGRRSDVQR